MLAIVYYLSSPTHAQDFIIAYKEFPEELVFHFFI
jgi:hypothetical protein